MAFPVQPQTKGIHRFDVGVDPPDFFGPVATGEWR
jgi:hypothetical protein